jgi:Acetyl-CoA carboxylase, carboxyltransferase component (subunits alpha and beta)
MATTATKAERRIPEVKNPEDVIQRSAVMNPYALAELVAGRRIAWKEIEDTRGMLEELLQTPYEELFDPKFDSPLYLGFHLTKDLQLEPAPCRPRIRNRLSEGTTSSTRRSMTH